MPGAVTGNSNDLTSEFDNTRDCHSELIPEGSSNTDDPVSANAQIALSKEAIKLRELHTSLRNKFSELYMTKQNMLQHEKPLLTALYLNKIGHKLYRNFCLSIELKQLQFRLSLLQAYVNRNKAPNPKTVEQEVKTQFEAYNRQIEAEAERLAAASRYLSGEFLMKDLFIQAQVAYELADLQTLQQIVLLLDHDSIETKAIEPIRLEKIIRKLEENIETLEKQISELETEFPFIYRKKIDDDEWVTPEIVTIEEEINQLNIEIEKYKTYITLLEEWRPE